MPTARFAAEQDLSRAAPVPAVRHAGNVPGPAPKHNRVCALRDELRLPNKGEAEPNARNFDTRSRVSGNIQRTATPGREVQAKGADVPALD